MPEGSPKKQTVASRKYQQKVGLISKSYKIKKDVADRFARVCEAAGVSQASKITELMEEFIKQSGGA